MLAGYRIRVSADPGDPAAGQRGGGAGRQRGAGGPGVATPVPDCKGLQAAGGRQLGRARRVRPALLLPPPGAGQHTPHQRLLPGGT